MKKYTRNGTKKRFEKKVKEKGKHHLPSAISTASITGVCFDKAKRNSVLPADMDAVNLDFFSRKTQSQEKR